jgi:deoxyadenosine/deoxycytidine kinase
MLEEKKDLLIVDIVGNIGAGKSTVLAQIQRTWANDARCHGRTAHVLCEPVDVWTAPHPFHQESHQDCKSSPLDCLYEDPKTHGFAFQMYAFQTRLEQLLHVPAATDVLFVERFCMSEVDVFAEAMVSQGALSAMQVLTYGHLKRTARQVMPRLFPRRSIRHETVYLRGQPKGCMARMRSRGRIAEVQGVPLAHVEMLHELHDARYMSGSIIVDIDVDLTTNHLSSHTSSHTLNHTLNHPTTTTAASVIDHVLRIMCQGSSF